MGSTSSALASSSSDPATPLRVLLDARKLGDGGIGVYIENTVAGLLSDPAISLSLLGRPDVISRYNFANNVNIVPDYSRPYSVATLFRLSSKVDWRKFDIFHTPHFTLPSGIPIPSVVTIHDLIHITSPERFFYPWIATPIIRNALRNAAKIITVSETSKREIVDVFGRELLSKITIIPNSLRESLSKYTSGDPLPRYAGVPSRYFLAVASNTKPHKGLKDLIDANNEVKHSTGTDVSLVIVGLGRSKKEDKSSGIIELGQVDEETLASLYSNALALIVPSKVEGFCLPVIEAHAFGTPVVARPVPAVLELMESEDEVASSFSVPSLAHAMKSVLGTPRRVERHLAPRFSIGSATEKLVGVYQALAQSK